MPVTSLYQILDKHTIIYMFCSKWISHLISYLMIRLRCSEKSVFAKEIHDNIYLSIKLSGINRDTNIISLFSNVTS